MDVRPSVQRKFLFFSMISGPIALVVTVLLAAFVAFTRPPAPVNTYKALTQYARSEYFARNFLLMWLAGGPQQESRFKEMSSVDTKVNLAPDPMTVTDINVTDVNRSTTDKVGEVEWAYTLAASIVPPGGLATRNFFRVTFVEVNGAFQVIALPRITTSGVTPIRVENAYGQHAALDGTLGKLVANFAQAYLVPGNSSQMGRYASENFTESPIPNSPYTSIRVTDIQVAGNTQVTEMKPGQSANILATIKASVSMTTFSTMQLPMKVTQTSNGQWLVDSFIEVVDFGAVTKR